MFRNLTITALLLLLISLKPTLANGLDPTRPLVGGATSQSKVVAVNNQLVLQSIISQKNKTKVIISGKLMATGDRIGQYQLIKIHDNSVTMAGPTEQLTLTIFSDVVAESK